MCKDKSVVIMEGDFTDHGGLDKVVYDSENKEKPAWMCFGQQISRSLLVFFSQIVIVFLIVGVAITNLSLSNSCEDTTLWVAILSSAVGYVLPGPKL